MPDGRPRTPLRDLRALFNSGTMAGLADDQLLRRYLDHRAEAETAFAALVDRHGPMVWGVCRRTLADPLDAEDAFQATFLILARRAGSVRVDGSLGRWLHGVARRVAARSLADSRRRRAREARAATTGSTSPLPDFEAAELREALDEELFRLPEKYRLPLILCHRDGLSYAEAAARLDAPPNTIKARLAKARDLLRARLTRRGFAPIVPPLLASTAARLIRSAPTPSAVHLANGVLRTMILIRLARVLAVLVPATAAFSTFANQAPTPIAAPVAPQIPPAPVAAPVAPQISKAQSPPSTIAGPMPAPEVLRRLLREAAVAAIAISREKPNGKSWTLRKIATAQARAGDNSGAGESYIAAIREAEVGAGKLDARQLWLIGHDQVKVGLQDEARATLKRAVAACPEPFGKIDDDLWIAGALRGVAEDQAKLGDREEARRTTDRLVSFAREACRKSSVGNMDEIIGADVAAALATVGDLEAASGWAGREDSAVRILAGAILASSEHLDRASARTHVEALAKILGEPTTVERNYSALSDLAEAQARIGDIERARRSAVSIGVGPSLVGYDMTDGQPYAMTRIARVQQEAGDLAGAAETLRLAQKSILDHPGMRGPEGRWGQVAGLQLGVSDIDGAAKSIAELPARGRSGYLTLLARSLAIAGRHDEARAALDRARQDARPKPVPGPVLPASGKRDAARWLELSQLAETQAMAGDVAEALKTVSAIDEEVSRRYALRKVVEARAAAGSVADALGLATDASRPSEDRRQALEGLGDGVAIRLQLERTARKAE